MDYRIKRHGIAVLLFGLVLTACGNQMDENITDPSGGETEAQRLYGFPNRCQEQLERGVLCEWNGDVYALLVDSGTIVRVAEQIDSDIE